MVACDTNFAYLTDEWRQVFGAINLAIGFMAFFGNSIAVLVLAKTKHFRNLSTCFLGSLVTTDFLVGIILEPMHVAQLFSEGPRDNCIFNSSRRYLSTLLIGASISSIGLISYDRYIHLSMPLTYSENMPKRKVASLITVGWFVPVIVPVLMKLGKEEQIIYSSIIFVYIFVYFTIIVTSYVFIVKIIRENENEMVKMEIRNQAHQGRTRHDVQAAKAVATLITCFAVTIIPISIYHCIVAVNNVLPQGIPGFKEMPREICYTAAMTLAMANSSINPLIYYFRNPKFKENLGKDLKRLCPEWCGSSTEENKTERKRS